MNIGSIGGYGVTRVGRKELSPPKSFSEAGDITIFLSAVFCSPVRALLSRFGEITLDRDYISFQILYF